MEPLDEHSSLTAEVQVQATPIEEAVLGPGTEEAIYPIAAVLGLMLLTHRFLRHLKSGRGAALEEALRSVARRNR